MAAVEEFKKEGDFATWMKEFWIGVDLDGTLFKVKSNVPPYPIGDPIPVMVDRVKHQLELGRTVKIFTARHAFTCEQVALWGRHPECSFKYQRPMIQAALDSVGLGHLEVTNVKDPYCVEIWDDRAVQVVRNVGTFATKPNSFFCPQGQDMYDLNKILDQVLGLVLAMDPVRAPTGPDIADTLEGFFHGVYKTKTPLELRQHLITLSGICVKAVEAIDKEMVGVWTESTLRQCDSALKAAKPNNP